VLLPLQPCAGCVPADQDCPSAKRLVRGLALPSSGVVLLQDPPGRLTILALAMLVGPIYRQCLQLLVRHRTASLPVPLFPLSTRCALRSGLLASRLAALQAGRSLCAVPCSGPSLSIYRFGRILHTHDTPLKQILDRPVLSPISAGFPQITRFSQSEPDSLHPALKSLQVERAEGIYGRIPQQRHGRANDPRQSHAGVIGSASVGSDWAMRFVREFRRSRTRGHSEPASHGPPSTLLSEAESMRYLVGHDAHVQSIRAAGRQPLFFSFP
jgi:hypothetical protein